MREEGSGGPNVSRRGVLVRLARRVTAPPGRINYDPAVAQLLPHDPRSARSIRRLLVLAPFAVFGAFAVVLIFFPDPLGITLLGITALSLAPMVVRALAQLKGYPKPVPGFRTIWRAGGMGFMVGFFSVFLTHLAAIALALSALLLFVDEASTRDSALSVTALGMPVGLLLWLLPQVVIPLAISAGTFNAIFYALVAVSYRRTLRRTFPTHAI